MNVSDQLIKIDKKVEALASSVDEIQVKENILNSNKNQ